MHEVGLPLAGPSGNGLPEHGLSGPCPPVAGPPGAGILGAGLPEVGTGTSMRKIYIYK